MKREERRQAIMDLLVEQGAVGLDDLAQRFAVSKMTVHRDLDDLEGAGVLRKVRGGASMEPNSQFESDFRFRERQGAAAKRRMARAALDCIEPGMTVIVNDGSMAAVLGRMLPEKRPLTVITNNFAVIDALKAEPGITLIALGGVYSAKFNGFFGIVTEESLARLRADVAFVSTPALAGLQCFHMDPDVVRTKRLMMEAAEQSFLLVNHQRFGRTALHLLSDLEAFSRIITDAQPEAALTRDLEGAGLPLTIAPQEDAEP